MFQPFGHKTIRPQSAAAIIAIARDIEQGSRWQSLAYRRPSRRHAFACRLSARAERSGAVAAYAFGEFNRFGGTPVEALAGLQRRAVLRRVTRTLAHRISGRMRCGW